MTTIFPSLSHVLGFWNSKIHWCGMENCCFIVWQSSFMGNTNSVKKMLGIVLSVCFLVQPTPTPRRWKKNANDFFFCFIFSFIFDWYTLSSCLANFRSYFLHFAHPNELPFFKIMTMPLAYHSALIQMRKQTRQQKKWTIFLLIHPCTCLST